MSDQPATILICDDEPHITHVVSSRFRREGYEVLIANDGEEAFELAREHTPDLVITDLQMPYTSGLELALRLRCNTSTATTPVIMLTARGYVLDSDDVRATNIRQVMSKPFSAREIVRLASTILNGESDQKREAA